MLPPCHPARDSYTYKTRVTNASTKQLSLVTRQTKRQCDSHTPRPTTSPRVLRPVHVLQPRSVPYLLQPPHLLQLLLRRLVGVEHEVRHWSVGLHSHAVREDIVTLHLDLGRGQRSCEEQTKVKGHKNPL